MKNLVLFSVLFAGAASIAAPVRGNAVADRLVAAKVSDVKVKGRVAEIQDRFFAQRVLGDYAKNEIWKGPTRRSPVRTTTSSTTASGCGRASSGASS